MLTALQATWCPPEREALRSAVQSVVSFYREVAPPIAESYGIPYPLDLEGVAVRELKDM
jgi:hypothetical protein